MCTAISYVDHNHYFGRNLDMTAGFAEEVVITPRKFPLSLRNGNALPQHYAMIGMATVSREYPLYYDATNEKGLSIAGLNFPDYACYFPRTVGKENIAPFELVPWVLSQCATVKEARYLLGSLNLWRLPFSREFLLTPLHWLLADREQCLVLECTADGLRLYDNPVQVLTNSPTFGWHMTNLASYRHLAPADKNDAFCGVPIRAYSGGMGAMGLPGDYSSASRFVKAAYLQRCNQSMDTEAERVRQFLHLLQAVAMPKGAVKQDNQTQYTLYSSCCNTDLGIYYYTTYENSRISAVHLHHCELDGSQLTAFPLRKFPEIFVQN